MTSPVTPFHSQLPVRIAFGDGVIGELPDALSALGAPSALVVVEEPVAGHPDVVAALAAAESAGVRLDRVVKGPGEPTFALADELAARVRDGALGAVVGIGGGSALDVAKAARIVADQGGGARDYADGEPDARAAAHRARPLPDDVGHGERGLRGERPHRHRARPEDRLRPPQHARAARARGSRAHAGASPGPTAHSGVDAMAQAIGACTVANSSPLSVAFGLEACHHVAHSLREAVADGSDAEARRRLSCASLTAGLAMNLSDCAADHALGQALGSVKHLPHGLTIGLVVAETLDVSRPDCADRLERVADALGEPEDEAGTADGSRAVRAVRRVLADLAFPTLRDVGVTEEDIPALVESATGEQSYNLDVDCHAWSAAEVEQAFRTALALESR